jgi:quercetin dioxygenase-like cupin family protein
MGKKKSKAAPAGRRDASKMPAGKVLDLANLVSYAAESIVSRTLVENCAGTVTIFAFAAGQGLSEHIAPFDALVEVLDGEGRFTVGGRANRVRAGQALLMPAGVPHAVEARKRFKMLLTLLRARGR